MTTSLITFINILILLAMAIGAPTVVIGLLSLFKVKIKKNWQVYLYAFTCGLLIILGTIGFLGEAIAHAKEHFTETIEGATGHHTHQALDIASTMQIIGVVAGGAIIGIIITILSRYVFTRITMKRAQAMNGASVGECYMHEHHHLHNHNEFLFNASDIDNKKQKWLPILLLCAHRIIDGIALGFMANSGDTGVVAGFENWGMIIIFVAHLIPTTIVIYLIQLEIQDNKRFKALGISIGLLAMMIPFTLLGGFLINNISSIWWLLPLLYAISGSLMTLGAIMEVIPEFIHARSAAIKEWVWIVVWLGAAIILAIILLLIHSH